MKSIGPFGEASDMLMETPPSARSARRLMNQSRKPTAKSQRLVGSLLPVPKIPHVIVRLPHLGGLLLDDGLRGAR